MRADQSKRGVAEPWSSLLGGNESLFVQKISQSALRQCRRCCRPPRPPRCLRGRRPAAGAGNRSNVQMGQAVQIISFR